MLLPSPFEPELFFKRVFPLNTMDRESAVWQFTHMYFRPSAVRRMVTTHRGAKGHWSRDDPSFLLVESAAIAAAAALWYLSPATPFRLSTLLRALSTLLLFDFFSVGVVAATALWLCLNKWGKASGAHRTDEDIEWRYCFDVYCNAYVAVLVDIDLGFLIVPVLSWLSKGWLFRVFVPNTLLLIGGIHFAVLAVPLRLVIPFIRKFGIGIVAAPMFGLYVMSLVASFEGGRRWLLFHFAA
jgi:hypothetical protein